MRVFDSTLTEIGTIEDFKFSDEDPGTETEDLERSDLQRNDSLIENIANAFRSDNLPEELRERLLTEGYVRIDGEGLFAADRYVPASQILSISGDQLMLSISKSELLKAH
ncbi:MAG TPA: hypothetical protein VGO70_01440 [Arsenicitalea sp.]|jgi:hypothetical protein|nr:hypothetical protein [Arsenicitalea sp.]